jgi:DNA-binding NarL/FixJ family response regulator
MLKGERMDMICSASTTQSTVKPFPCLERLSQLEHLSQLELLSQTKWIQPEICISIISPSCLLREAVFHQVNTTFPVQEVQALQEWVLLDYGIGRDLLTSTIYDWRTQHPQTYLIVIELQDDPDAILECIAAGAHAYVLRGASGEQIIETMQQVDRGMFQCPISITDRLVERLSQQQGVNAPLPASLTQRECEVLHCIEQGQRDREIATELCISVRTVKHHVHNLLGKLQVQSRWQAAQLARDNDWFEEDRSR